MRARANNSRGFTLLEVLVGLGILTAGVLGVMAVYPTILRAQTKAELLTEAAALAQMKVEEVRRDDSSDQKLLKEIKALDEPTAPIPFVNEPRLAYSFSGQSVLDDHDTSDTAGVARVLIRYAPAYRSEQDVIYELRFN